MTKMARHCEIDQRKRIQLIPCRRSEVLIILKNMGEKKRFLELHSKVSIINKRDAETKIPLFNPNDLSLATCPRLSRAELKPEELRYSDSLSGFGYNNGSTATEL